MRPGGTADGNPDRWVVEGKSCPFSRADSTDLEHSGMRSVIVEGEKLRKNEGRWRIMVNRRE
jgi:hypothetical protein